MPNYNVTSGQDGPTALVLDAASEAIITYTANYPTTITVQVTAGGAVLATVDGRSASDGTSIANETTATFDARGVATPVRVRLISADGSTVTVKGYVGDRPVGTAPASFVPVYTEQPVDADLTELAAIAGSNDDLIQQKAGVWTSRTPAQVKTDLVLAKADVGLGNVDNTADASKPVSAAAQAALDLKAPLASPAFTGTPTGLTKTHVGLSNVDNTSDASKPVSTATTTAINAVKPDIQVFLANGTWTKPAGCTRVQVVGVGSGGGGGSGARLASGTASSGGAGGGGAGYSSQTFRAVDLSATEAVIVHAGGAGGAAITADNTIGQAAQSGSPTQFGNSPNYRIRVGNGGGGGGGNTGAATAGSVVGAMTNGLAGGIGNVGAAGSASSGASFGAGGGGGGGGISATPTATNGGSSGSVNNIGASAITGGAATGASGTNGVSATANSASPAQGGSGGGASITGPGGNGGAGGTYGAGGGGGGSSLNGFDSGAGGNGGPGILIVISD